ncbi:hypothetical protein BC829DRAFT_267407 [Chytridium lagenaria]|nr:hypothetical protein BC829DRAFT_267407 [Chytridium lagenaria]
MCCGPFLRRKIYVNKQGQGSASFQYTAFERMSYSVSTNQGYLKVKESADIDVVFKPNGIGRFANSFIVECKGISYKEIVVVGIGGQMKLDISPPVVDIGRSPCDLRVFHVIMLTNNGDVTLHVDWELVENTSITQTCSITLPDAVVAAKSYCAMFVWGDGSCSRADLIRNYFKDKGKILQGPYIRHWSKNCTYERSRKILESEKLAALTAPGPFGREIEPRSVEDNLKKLHRSFLADLAVIDALVVAMDQARSVTTPQIIEITDDATPSREDLSSSPAKNEDMNAVTLSNSEGSRTPETSNIDVGYQMQEDMGTTVVPRVSSETLSEQSQVGNQLEDLRTIPSASLPPSEVSINQPQIRALQQYHVQLPTRCL